MPIIIVLLIAIGAFLILPIQIIAGEASHKHMSKYAGQENRKIKSLSPDDIEELQNGNGWGLAKAAELNGVPGPVHLLELKDEIGLSKQQAAKIKILYDQMKIDAILLGKRLIAQELEWRNVSGVNFQMKMN